MCFYCEWQEVQTSQYATEINTDFKMHSAAANFDWLVNIDMVDVAVT